MERDVTLKNIEKYSKNYRKNKVNLVKENAVRGNGIIASSLNPNEITKLQSNFSINIDSGLITNQMRSGRCWMFAAMNVLRLEVMKNLNIDNMELSQSFTLFYDKLEKTNFFLESELETLDEPIGSRLFDHLLRDPLGDGGQWTMIVNLIKKYGVCPKTAYPESHSSSNTYPLDTYLTLKLREYACTLRKEHEKGKSIEELRELKEEMLNEVYRMLAISLGEPPKKFDYEYYDKKHKYHKISNITPLEFFEKYVKLNLDDYVSVLNCPSPLRPINRAITVKFLNNVVGGDKVVYLNLDINRVKELCINQLKDGEVIWFGSDVGQFSNSEKGLLAQEILDVDKLFDINFGLTKGERVDYGESLMTHAMVITGVNLDKKGKSDKWRVENSWGDKIGDKGYFVMSDKWFDEFVFQAVINKKYLTEDELKILEEEPVALEPWDPMGSLAF